MLLVKLVATGVHVDGGGGTVYWGLVYLKGQPPSKQKVETALREAGFDFAHNVLIQAMLVLTEPFVMKMSRRKHILVLAFREPPCRAARSKNPLELLPQGLLIQSPSI